MSAHEHLGEQFEDYRSSHRAPGPDPDFARSSMDDPSDVMPDYPYGDVKKAIHWYGSPTEPSWSHESHAAMVTARNSPDAEVPIYRAVPKVEHGINPGDWVTPSRSYAQQHAVSNGGPDWPVVEGRAKASELYSEGDLHEWGYHPK